MRTFAGLGADYRSIELLLVLVANSEYTHGT